MAQSRAPYAQTNETRQMEFPTNPLGRSGLFPAKDANLMNIMVDVTKGGKTPKVYFRSRGGLSLAYNTSAQVGRGLHYWVYGGVGYCISVAGNTIYSNGNALGTISTSTGSVGFCEHVSSAGVVTLFFCDGTNGYVFTSPGTFPTKITDSNFPSPHIPSPQFMDGYIFLAIANGEDIHNCALDTPLTWTISGSPSFISAEMYPDTIVTLSKNNNYIYAVGRLSVEYFYDAGNSTGSPLARQTPAVQQFGTAAADSVVQTEEEVILIGDTGNGGKTVWTIDGFKAKEVGTSWVKVILTTEGANLASCNAYSIRVSGQKLYVVQLTSRTLVYNFDTELWSEWSSGVTGSSRFIGYNADDGPNGTPYLQDASNGCIYAMSENVFTDNGTNFLIQIVTEREDYGNMNIKTCSRFSLLGDVPDTTDNTLSISWSDDDYNTWSIPRTLTFNDYPSITQLGRFRRRAYKIQYNLPHLLRLEGYEVDINKGDQ
jgi:Phage stabilisation protein